MEVGAFSRCPLEANITGPPKLIFPFGWGSLDVRENLSMAMFGLLRASGIFSIGLKGMQSTSYKEDFLMLLPKKEILLLLTLKFVGTDKTLAEKQQ